MRTTSTRARLRTRAGDQPAAVILKMVPDSYAHGRLCAIRTLGKMGVRTVVVTERRVDPASLSKWADRIVVIPFSATPGEEAKDALVALGRELGDRPVLLATDDVGALFVDDHADALCQVYRFPIGPRGLARSLADKGNLHELSRQAGIPTPEAYFPKDRRDASLFAARSSYPVVLKSMDPQLMRRRPGARSVVIASDPGALLRGYDEMEVEGDRPNVMFQEFIPGDPLTVWMFNGYFDASSRCLVGFTGQKLRQYLPATGATSLGVCRANPEVASLASRFLAAIGYRGIVDMGFRYDARDGRYKLLDVNPRMGATFRLFVGSGGLDVVRAMYLDLTGQPVPAEETVEGRRWVVEPFDLRSYTIEHRAGGISTRDWLRSLRGVDEWAWWDPSDPLPALAVAVAMGAQSARARLRRARGVGLGRFPSGEPEAETMSNPALTGQRT